MFKSKICLNFFFEIDSILHIMENLSIKYKIALVEGDSHCGCKLLIRYLMSALYIFLAQNRPAAYCLGEVLTAVKNASDTMKFMS